MATIAKLHEAKSLLEDLTIEDCGNAKSYERQMQKLRDIDAAIEEAISTLAEQANRISGAMYELTRRAQ